MKERGKDKSYGNKWNIFLLFRLQMLFMTKIIKILVSVIKQNLQLQLMVSINLDYSGYHKNIHVDLDEPSAND